MYITKNFTDKTVKNITMLIPNKSNYTQYLITAVSLIIVLALLSVTAVGAYTLLPAKIHYHITKTFKISQDTGDAQIYLGLILPKSGPYQSVNNLSVKWDGNQESDSRAYVDLLKLSGQIITESEKLAAVEYDISLPQGISTWQAPIDKFDLLPEEGIESNHEEIKLTATKITSSSNGNPAFKIFQFISSYLDYSEYGCEETNISALETLRTKISACIGYSRLMVALCRSSGIPAKMIIGTILPDVLFSLPQVVASGVPGSGHAWVEFNSQNSWHFADPSWGHGFVGFLAYNRYSGRHLSLGEFDHFISSKDELNDWATNDASLKDSQLTSVFASNSDQTEFSSETTISKTWDQRWLNTVIVLVLVSFVLSKIRDRFFMGQRNTSEGK